MLSKVHHLVLDVVAQAHLKLDNTKRLVHGIVRGSQSGHREDLSPSLDYRRLRVDARVDNIAGNQLSKEDLGTANLNWLVVLAEVNIKLDGILLKEVHIEAINLVLKSEL